MTPTAPAGHTCSPAVPSTARRVTMRVPAGKSNCAVSGRSSVTSKHPHLRRRADQRLFRPHRQEAHMVAEAPGHAGRPGLELGAGPLEAVVAVPEAPGGQAGPLAVV